jgi:GNAT superfamily N-acetyltransferase
MTELIGGLKQYVEEGSEEDFFLTRLTYPHLRPSDKAELVFTEAGGERRADVMVKIEDDDGMPFYVRHPISPKEVERLHRQFLSAKLEVTFRPEHHFLVAVNHRGDLVGGLFYELYPDEARAHLEKIVVHQSVRKKGISDGLMHELLSRLKAQGLRALTTGFFRPGYFYRFGFTIERGYAGLVRPLDDGRLRTGPTEPADVPVL